MLPSKDNLTRTKLRTPKAAAIAGILFSILSLMAFWLLRISIPAESLTPSMWLRDHAKAITFALGLIPFAGIAFLWFIGVLRDRLGQREHPHSRRWSSSRILSAWVVTTNDRLLDSAGQRSRT